MKCVNHGISVHWLWTLCSRWNRQPFPTVLKRTAVACSTSCLTNSSRLKNWKDAVVTGRHGVVPELEGNIMLDPTKVEKIQSKFILHVHVL